MTRLISTGLLLLSMMITAPAMAAATLTVTDDAANNCYIVLAHDEVDVTQSYWQVKVDKQSGGIYSFLDLTDAGNQGVHADYCGTEAYNRQCTLLFFDGRGGNIFTRRAALSGLADRLTFTTAGDNSSFTITYTENAHATSFFHNQYSAGDMSLTPGELLTTITLVIRPPTPAGTTWDWTMSFENVSTHTIASMVWAGEWIYSNIHSDIVKTLDSDPLRLDGTWDPSDPTSFMRWTIGQNPALGLTAGRTIIVDYRYGLQGETHGGGITTGAWAGYDRGLYAAAYSYNGTHLAAAATRINAGQVLIDITSGGEPPVANCGPDITVRDFDSSGAEIVTLDGSASTDSDGTIVNWVWKHGTTVIGSGEVISAAFDVGTYEITLEVTDNEDLTSTDTVTVTVQQPILATLSYAYGATNTTYRYRPLIITATHEGATVWEMRLWVPQEGYLQTTHAYWLAGEIAGFKDVAHGGAEFEYSPEAGAASSAGLIRMSAMQGDFNDSDGQQSSYYEFTKTYLIQTGVLGVLTVRINAPSIDDADYRTVITGHYEIINSSGTAFSLWNTGQTAGSGSLALEDSGLTNWAIVNPTGSTGKPNAHITDVSNGHQLYEIYDWFGSTETSLLPGFYAKLVTKNNVETQSRNIRPGLTFELRCDSMDFYYSDFSDSIKGSTAVAATTGVQCKLSNQPGIFGNGSSLPDGESVVLGWEGIISTRPTPISPVARAGSDFEVIDADDSGAELVTLDGSASYDHNGEIISYVWTIDDAVVATGEQPQINLPVGLHIITLTLTDNEFAMSSDQIAVSVRSANGYTWYIDYDGGDDNNDGRSPSSPFKRCPGDANATGQAASTVLSPGDTIIFKGGVIYRGHITANWSGLSQVPIRYDGNTAGTFGTGRAIIDGSEILTGWTACQSANDCDGNPNWQHIYYTYLPAGVTAFSANLSENDDMLWLAQDPNQPDPFFFDRVDTYATYDSATTSTIRCDSYFTSSDPDYWNGWTYVLVWAAPNNVYPRRVTAYNPSTHTITYDALGSAPYDPGKFAMCNSLKLLDTPGEYVVREDQTNGLGGVKVYLWPLTAGVSDKTFTVSTRKYIFSLGSQSHISVEGFILQKASSGLGEGNNCGSAIRNSGTASSIWIVDNEIRHNKSPSQQPTIGLRSVTDCLIDSNFIQNNCSNRGMILSNCTYSSIRNNILWRNGSTAIDYYSACNSDVSFNIVSEHFGCHANGISVYLDSSDVMVFGNAVYDGNIALTAEKSTNITIAYNTFHTATGLYTVALWGNTDGVAVHNNVIQNIGKPGSALAVNSLNNINITVRNNILDGCNIIYQNAGTTEYNIYTSLNWTQKDKYGWQLGTGELLGAAADLFTDPLNFDYHLKDGAAAIDAGTDLGYQQDKDGNPVPANGVVDIGSYEKQ